MITGYRVRITAADGSEYLWHKNGRLHQLSPQLGPTWLSHFNKDIWWVTSQGAFVPPGADAQAQPVQSVALEAVEASES